MLLLHDINSAQNTPIPFLAISWEICASHSVSLVNKFRWKVHWRHCVEESSYVWRSSDDLYFIGQTGRPHSLYFNGFWTKEKTLSHSRRGISICSQLMKYTYSQSWRFSCCLGSLTIPFHKLKTKQIKLFVRCSTTNAPSTTQKIQLFKFRLVLFRKFAIPSPHCRWAWPVSGAVSMNGRTPSVTSAGCWTTPFAPGSPPSTSRSDPQDHSWCKKTLDAAQKWRRRYCC